MAVWSPRKETVDAAIAFSKEKCGCAHMELKREQRRALTKVLGRKDSGINGEERHLDYLWARFRDIHQASARARIGARARLGLSRLG